MMPLLVCLCWQCRTLYETGGYSVTPAAGDQTKRKCENCGGPVSEAYTVQKKMKRPTA